MLEGKVIQCKTEKQAKKLLRMAKDMGYRWVGIGDTSKTMQEAYADKTCYKFERSKISCGFKKHYKVLGYKVIKFKSIDDKTNV